MAPISNFYPGLTLPPGFAALGFTPAQPAAAPDRNDASPEPVGSAAAAALAAFTPPAADPESDDSVSVGAELEAFRITATPSVEAMAGAMPKPSPPPLPAAVTTHPTTWLVNLVECCGAMSHRGEIATPFEERQRIYLYREVVEKTKAFELHSVIHKSLAHYNKKYDELIGQITEVITFLTSELFTNWVLDPTSGDNKHIYSALMRFRSRLLRIRNILDEDRQEHVKIQGQIIPRYLDPETNFFDRLPYRQTPNPIMIPSIPNFFEEDLPHILSPDPTDQEVEINRLRDFYTNYVEVLEWHGHYIRTCLACVTALLSHIEAGLPLFPTAPKDVLSWIES
jgi:hypothetical protein